MSTSYKIINSIPPSAAPERNRLYSFPEEAERVATSLLTDGFVDSDITITEEKGSEVSEPNTVADGRKFLTISFTKKANLVNEMGRMMNYNVPFKINAGLALEELVNFPLNDWKAAYSGGPPDYVGDIEKLN